MFGKKKEVTALGVTLDEPTTMRRYKFTLELQGIADTPEEAWGRALAAYYFNDMRGKILPTMPIYEDLGQI